MKPGRDTGRPRPKNAAPSVSSWDTREALPAGFAAAWSKALETSPHGHFAFCLDFLRWEAARGRRARALLLEGGGRRGLVVQRRDGGRWVSGWPWRWQALICGADPDEARGMSEGDALWIHRGVSAYAGREATLTYLPHVPARLVPGWDAGATILQDIRRSDEELLAGMDSSKRRLVKRARGRGEIEIRTAQGEDDRRAYWALEQEVRQRLGLPFEPVSVATPASGEKWREWELPWMWLLVARRGVELVAGLGDSVHRGGALQGRGAAATLEARRDGVTVLLGYEEMRQGRDLGHRWLNYGGDTPFKREMCGRLGQRVPVFAWLGGGGGQRLWQVGEASLRRMRPAFLRVRRWLGLARSFVLALVPTALESAPTAVAGMLGI